MQEIAAGLFVHIGHMADATPDNEGDIANVGFVIGTRCVAVIDSGGSLAEGTQLHAAITARTALPVCYVINTHVHPDHVYGNAAFLPDKPHFVGHQYLAQAMQARRAYYTPYLMRTIGPQLAAGSELVLPDMAVAQGQDQVLDLGGRRLILHAWPTAHTDNDLTIFDENSRTLWLGDLLFRQRIPVIDGSVLGWLAALQTLAAMPAVRVVPGHGEPSMDWPGALGPQRHYLQVVRDGVRMALAQHHTITDAVREVGLDERSHWQLFNDFHAHNVTTAFTELEWEN